MGDVGDEFPAHAFHLFHGKDIFPEIQSQKQDQGRQNQHREYGGAHEFMIHIAQLLQRDRRADHASEIPVRHRDRAVAVIHVKGIGAADHAVALPFQGFLHLFPI